ncbi:cell pattern formation-associated protein stuA [Thelonectria olida]|uniref:Cell pattern formation-associated protein stuA n=1 Tax=Thelonectria olida TaxID=1576542 RepID=A0A9P8WJZ9_9HYPO|nr:cell pattern formation-associated protein stuA [Thelonectria olida]
MNSDRLPSLPLPPPGQAYSSGTSSPRVSSIASNGSYSSSQSSFTLTPTVPKAPSPNQGLPANAITGPSTTIASYDAMNQPPAEMYYPPQQQHLSAGQAAASQAVTSSGINHYSQHQQPPLLQPGPAQYSASPQYPGYNNYTNGLTSPPTAAPSVANPMNAQHVLPLPGVAAQGGMQSGYQTGFDTTGQHPPPGMKPRVTATLWEDEGSLCFQVEARGICVARREDNHMINGTKLLNVAGMTRGRRDGILKSEKVRHVVKIGPMHLKGVWIPYDRALDFANKEKITELLYPLFVHNIGALLYHPTNQSRTTQVMAAAERRKQEQSQMRNAGHGLPSIGHSHPPSMALPGPQTSLPSHSMGRPALDRAHTFPTPPTSASSAMGNMGSSENFTWQGQGMSGPQGANHMGMDNGLANARSMPTTPATTPPGSSIQSMQQSYQPGAQQYDNSRPMYNTQSQSPYQAANANPQDRMYGQANSYQKSEMAPPTSRPSASGPSGEQQDTKPPSGLINSEHSTQPQGGEDETEHEHEAEYTHDSGAYDGSRNNYNYTAPGVGALANDSNLSADMNGSPNHPPSSGRATPRTTAPTQSYYPQQPGYNTPPRVQQTTSNLYNVMSNDRASANGAPGNDVYAPAADLSGLPNGYAPQASVMNGAGGVLKRGREDEEELPRPGSEAGMDLKRRKTLMEATVTAPSYDAMTRPASAIANRRR